MQDIVKDDLFHWYDVRSDKSNMTFNHFSNTMKQTHTHTHSSNNVHRQTNRCVFPPKEQYVYDMLDVKEKFQGVDKTRAKAIKKIKIKHPNSSF